MSTALDANWKLKSRKASPNNCTPRSWRRSDAELDRRGMHERLDAARRPHAVASAPPSRPRRRSIRGVQTIVTIGVLGAVLVIAAVMLAVVEPAGRSRSNVGGWTAPFGIVLVVDRLAALLLVVSAAVLLAVLVFSVGQGLADGDRETPVSIYYPTYLILATGVFNAFIAGDLFNLYVSFEILLVGELRAHHGRRHRAAHPGRHHLHRGQSGLVGHLPRGDRDDLRRDRHGEHRPALAAARGTAARMCR